MLSLVSCFFKYSFASRTICDPGERFTSEGKEVVFTPMNVSTSSSFLSVTKLAKVSEPKVLCSGPDDYVS